MDRPDNNAANLPPAGPDPRRLAEFVARQEILTVLARYARGVDRADAQLLRSCYHPGAIEEHGTTYSGPADEYITGAMERLELMGPMAHYLCSSTSSLTATRPGSRPMY